MLPPFDAPVIRHRGWHHFDKISHTEHQGIHELGRGRVFYVNTAAKGGTDVNMGLNPALPMLTITGALDRCEDYRHDTVCIIDYWQAAGETWPINVDVHQVHIHGLTAPAPGIPYPAIHPPADTAAFLLGAGDYGSISNLTIGGGNSHGGIDLCYDGTTQVFQAEGFEISGCTFGHVWFGTPLNGIRLPATANTGAYGLRIINNSFLGDLATKGAISGNAIDILKDSNPSLRDSLIANNRFLDCQKNIVLVNSYSNLIEGNEGFVPDTAQGEMVDLDDACVANVINRNQAMQGPAAGLLAQAPYRDLNGPNNHWGHNEYNGVEVEPVTV